MPVTIDNRHPTLRVSQRILGAHLRAALHRLDRARAYVDVSLVTDQEIRALNRDHRGIDAVTDVLSFAFEEAEGPDVPISLLGDIVISLDTARRQANAMRAVLGQAGAQTRYGLREETLLLATHGLLHLLGWDHQTDGAARRMEGLERELLGERIPVDPHACDRSEHGL